MAAHHGIELSAEDTQPAHSAPYWAGRIESMFKKIEITDLLELEVIQPAQTRRIANWFFIEEARRTLIIC